MKPRCSNRQNHALTIEEVLVSIVVIALLAAMVMTARPRKHDWRRYTQCANNLKMVGLAFRIWEGDNNDKYPMEISMTNGGTSELMDGPDAWRAFQIMSNELSTPKILICPQDAVRVLAATNFGDDLKNKISYFIGMDASDAGTNTFLSGDDNFLLDGLPAKSGMAALTSNTATAWDTSRHVSVESHGWFSKTKKGWGYVCLGDGSVYSLSKSELTNHLRQTGLATNRFAIP
jgi:hypothetical protein